MLKLLSLFFCIYNANSYSMVALKQPNSHILKEALNNVSNPLHAQYGQYWSQREINDLVSPSPKHVDEVIDYFNNNGLNCVQIGGSSLKCDDLNMICLIDIPDLIDFIEISHKNFPLTKDKSLQQNAEYVGREIMIPLYNITHNKVMNSNISVCAVEYQNAGGFNQTDLLTQQKLNGEPQKKITHIMGNNQGTMLETQLDVQMMSQVAENVDVWFWEGEQWLYSFAVNFLNSTDIPDILSMSWGWSAKQQCYNGLGSCPGNMTSSQYIHRTNLEYVKMGLRGVTITVSSGDAGAPGRTNEGCALNIQGVTAVNPAFPGSSPYITSVSATYLVSNNGVNNWKTPLCKEYGCINGTEELPCNFADTGWTTGGGFAIFNESRPEWQNEVVEKYLKSKVKKPKHFEKDGRGYPDVSALGHNCPVVTQGVLMGVDGTSCSSPVFAAIIALLNDHQVSKGKPKLGFINPVLYSMYKDSSKIFNDITKGNNWCTEEQCCNNTFGYETSVGWDPVTGLGTPNVGLMLEWLDKNIQI